MQSYGLTTTPSFSRTKTVGNTCLGCWSRRLWTSRPGSPLGWSTRPAPVVVVAIRLSSWVSCCSTPTTRFQPQTLPFVRSKDRLVVHQYGPPDSEMAAVMRHLAGLSPGKSEYPELKIKKKEVPYWKKTTKKERLVIAEFIIEQAAKFKVHLSLRMLRIRSFTSSDRRNTDTPRIGGTL